jgi:hypothetical protein
LKKTHARTYLFTISGEPVGSARARLPVVVANRNRMRCAPLPVQRSKH